MFVAVCTTSDLRSVVTEFGLVCVTRVACMHLVDRLEKLFDQNFAGEVSMFVCVRALHWPLLESGVF